MNYIRLQQNIIAEFHSMTPEQKGVVLQGIAETFYQFQYERPAYERSIRNLGWSRGEKWMELGCASAVAKVAGFDIQKAVESIRQLSLPKIRKKLESLEEYLEKHPDTMHSGTVAYQIKKLREQLEVF